MRPEQGAARLNHLSRQWHALAERRLAYFTELYRSGRWKRYYAQEHFALRMLDVIKAAKAWSDIAGRTWNEPPVKQPPLTRDDDLRPAA